MNNKIIGFTALKNPLSQGYPFLEAIYSFLNFGDKLYIIDGNSNDGTEKILEKLTKNKKIIISKKSWTSDKVSNKRGRVIGSMHEQALELIKMNETHENSYVFELQANEVVHEDCYAEFRIFVEQLSKIRAYILPYQLMVGDRLIDFDWRIRLAKLNRNVAVHGDSTSLLILKDVNLKWFLSSMAALSYNYLKYRTLPMRFLRGYPNDILPVPLSKSIFRYGRIFPQDIKRKLIGHKMVYTSISDTFTKEEKFVDKLLQKKISVSEFYRVLAYRLSENQRGNLIVKNPIKIPKLKHPKIMQEVLHLNKYYPRSKLINAIIRL